MAILGGSIGLILTTIIIAVIATVIIVNLRDLREWKRYVAMKEENELAFQNIDFENPLFDSEHQPMTKPNKRQKKRIEVDHDNFN